MHTHNLQVRFLKFRYGEKRMRCTVFTSSVGLYFFEAPIFSSQPVTLPLLPIPFTTALPRRSRLMILHSMGKCGDHVYLDHLQNKHHFYFFPSMSSYVCNLSQEKRLGMLSQVSVFFTRQVAHHTFFVFGTKCH